MKGNTNENEETTLSELARMVANGFAAAKADVKELRGEMNERFNKVDIELYEIHGLISTHRTDLDNLAHRVKKLEESVFPNIQ